MVKPKAPAAPRSLMGPLALNLPTLWRDRGELKDAGMDDLICFDVAGWNHAPAGRIPRAGHSHDGIVVVRGSIPGEPGDERGAPPHRLIDVPDSAGGAIQHELYSAS